MTVISTTTPLQLTAGASLLQNQGLMANAEFTASITSYNTSNALGNCVTAITLGAGGTGNLSAGTIISLETIGNTTCPALGDSIGNAYGSLPRSAGFTTLLSQTANKYMGNGDLTKFVQVFNSAQAYVTTSNQQITSVQNAQNYLGNVFTNINNMVTGDITAINASTSLWGEDLTNLGSLINLANLDEMGTPLALLQQIATIGGLSSTISLIMINAGVDVDVMLNLNSPETTSSSVTISNQKAMYKAMTQITGDTLSQVLQILGVKTANINTMADLLNPYKLFPNSFQSLTVYDVNNVQQYIYTDLNGTVNNTLSNGLPALELRTFS